VEWIGLWAGLSLFLLVLVAAQLDWSELLSLSHADPSCINKLVPFADLDPRLPTNFLDEEPFVQGLDLINVALIYMIKHKKKKS